MPKCVLRPVLAMMHFTPHATRRAPHGASRLVQAMSAWLTKPDVLRPGIVGLRGSMVTPPGPCTTEHTPPPTIQQLASVGTDDVKLYMYIGVRVGWQRRCKTCQSLRELDNQGKVFILFFGHHDGTRVRS